MLLNSFLKDLESLVNIDSYSYDPVGKAKVVDFFKQKFQSIGWIVEEHFLDEKVGSALICKNTLSDEFDVVLSGHMDTVFKTGTVSERPFKIEGDKAFGPGIADMKAGLLAGFYACQALTEENALQNARICVLFNPDEEISSIYSRPLLEKIARKTRYAIILEAARINGNLVNERKGIGKYVIEFLGKSAHSAVDPQNGANSINTFIRIAQELLNSTAPEKGTTMNIGTVEGGTTPNTVPDYVKTQIDCRFTSLEESERLNQVIYALHDTVTEERVKIKVSGGITRPPWRRTEAGLKFCAAVDEIKERLGIKAEWESTAGGSDGNFFAALGAIVIDGMGPSGGKWHSPDEYLNIDSIEPRIKLVTEVIKYCTQK
ncbi:M20 family metallopeptidase [Pasteurella canis]|uniref:Carboxypeptidase G2 n=1 Tax=Pasteurella canis TaxID=753 RepID=A0A379EUU5_9PAST|nr:M20 family metallopeptidase [Pasteurella canis]MXN89054.1 M20/M25/M40 family metallo-hydrolase [Pasteurella canis]UAY78668.1 M20 family metallopeptidase [Pasteurella canis]UEA15945.1 M20 family metallopeptidase [Pasteurella canis]UEC22377.1 M20 family metallopeptidase [Pasteurella canis]SPY32303.1 carboxypeptidase G2 [Pasteurella canis]